MYNRSDTWPAISGSKVTKAGCVCHNLYAVETLQVPCFEKNKVR